MLPKVVPFPVLPIQDHPVTVQALGDLEPSIREVRAAIANASSVAEAYQIYRHVSVMANLLAELTDDAGQRCIRLLEAL